MLIRDTTRLLREHLLGSGQSLEHLDPWQAWKAFKHSLHTAVTDGYDAAALQFAPGSLNPAAPEEARLFLIRQFTERDPADGEDQLLGRVVVELLYPAEQFRRFEPVDLWSLDFPTLEEWATIVEGLPPFQEAMAREPSGSEVYYDEGLA